MANISSFKPIIDENATILILGSIPGVESLLKQQYYANQRNQFWRMMFTLFDLPIVEKYEDKIAFLHSKQIALWDVIASCYREGSLDCNIEEERINDFSTLFQKYPKIQSVIFNGDKAYQSFKKNVGFKNNENITYIKLPSTSPAHTVSFESKFDKWREEILTCYVK